MSSRRPTVRPVVVEVRPDHVPSNIAPSSPPSPKAVRFAPTSDNRLSRPLTSTEAWSLYYFEYHARHCSTCYQPLEVFRRDEKLCDAGHGLAQDVACHVYHRDGEIYSIKKDDSQVVRVEIPHGYSQLRSLLRAMDHGIRRSRHRTTPIVSYDRTYPVSARRSYAPESKERQTVILQPASSMDNDRSHRRGSKHKSVRYSTVEVDHDDVEQVSAVKTVTPSTTTSATSRRGSLYEKDMQRKPKDYRVEIREPSDRRERRKSHRDSGIWI